MKRISQPAMVRDSSFQALIERLRRQAEIALQNHLGAMDLNTRLYWYLMVLAERDGISQKQLGLTLGDPEYAVSRGIDALAERGFAKRCTHPKSQRSVLIFLTEEGSRKAADLSEIDADVNSICLKNLSSDERTDLIFLMRKVLGVVGL